MVLTRLDTPVILTLSGRTSRRGRVKRETAMATLTVNDLRDVQSDGEVGYYVTIGGVEYRVTGGDVDAPANFRCDVCGKSDDECKLYWGDHKGDPRATKQTLIVCSTCLRKARGGRY